MTASENDNSDLYWAIRGGGGNFGVITEFVFQLYPQRKTVFAGMVIYTPDSLEKIIEVTKCWWPNAGQDEAMCQIATVDPDGCVSCFAYSLNLVRHTYAPAAYYSFAAVL